MMPSINGSRRRHSKQPSVSKKIDPPPPLCLASRSSSSSKSSDTQATPRSIFHSSLRPSKRGVKDMKPTARDEIMRPKVDAIDKGNVDVFAFMEREEDPWDTSPAQHITHEPELSEDEASPRLLTAKRMEESQMSPRYSDLEVRANQDGIHRNWGRASVHSDSGISMHSGSPDQDSPTMQHKYPIIQEDIPDTLETSIEDDEPQLAELRDSPDFSANHGMFVHRRSPSIDSHPEDVPEACQPPPQQAQQQGMPIRQLEMPEMPTRPIRDLVHRRPRLEQRAPVHKSGYELIASNISSHDDTVLKPIYRKFETLNNRMLLYLQDEISEIEDQLQELDAAIAQEEADMGRGPASRRSEAKLPSQLQWHRLDLLGRSFAKVEQYNRALTSYSKLIKSLDPASTAGIAAYRQWIAEHTPVAQEETTFLQKENDLITILPSQKTIPEPPQSQSHQQLQQHTKLDSPVMVLAFAFISTIFVFKVVPGLFARLVISAMVGIASLCTLAPTVPMSLKGFKELKRVIGVYTAVMFALAVVVN